MGKEKDKLCDIVIQSEINTNQKFLTEFGSLYFCSKDKVPLPVSLAKDKCKIKYCQLLKTYYPDNPAEDKDND